jgi:hypothetical protein
MDFSHVFQNLTQKPTGPIRRQQSGRFETDNGRSVLAAGMGLHAPFEPLPDATRIGVHRWEAVICNNRVSMNHFRGAAADQKSDKPASQKIA